MSRGEYPRRRPASRFLASPVAPAKLDCEFQVPWFPLDSLGLAAHFPLKPSNPIFPHQDITTTRRITDGISTFSHHSQDEWEPESWVDIFKPVAAYFHKILLSSRHLQSDPEVIGSARKLINLAHQWASSEAVPQVPPIERGRY